MSNLTLRPYRPDDATALADVFHAAVHAIPDRFYGPEEREAWAPTPPSYESWAARFAAAPPEVAVEGDVVVGFMCLEPDGHVDLAYVHPAHQGRGVATALYESLEERARSERLGRLFAKVSDAARPFFSRRGWRVLRRHRVERGRRWLENTAMDKRLVSPAERGRIFVVGNSGAGKSTLAGTLAEALDRARVDLDEVAFADQAGTRLPVAESLARLADRPGLDTAVIEGCYADLVGALADPRDHLVWLDLSVADCQANARERPWEPHKWPSAAAQDAFLPRLLEFIAGYETSADVTGRAAHAELFAGFAGTRERHTERPGSASVGLSR